MLSFGSVWDCGEVQRSPKQVVGNKAHIVFKVQESLRSAWMNLIHIQEADAAKQTDVSLFPRGSVLSPAFHHAVVIELALERGEH